MLQIVQAPKPVLASIASPIQKIDKTITALIKEMTESLLHAKDPEGVGLAAPQVGKSLQLFIIKESKKDPLLVFINPELIIPTGEKLQTNDESDKEHHEVKLEGCLSLQDIWGIVHRYPKIELVYLNEKGEKCHDTFEGFMATIIQHEFDHLQGILFPRRVLEQKGQLYKSVKNKKGEMEFDEISV
jgi:peptide deformylase